MGWWSDRGATRSTGAIVMLGGLMAGLLVGCSPDPAVSPSASASPTLPAPMPSPAKPALWSDNGDAGAGAAAVWFVRDLHSYVMETNDLTEWQALSESDCVFCTNTADDAKVGIAKGTVLREGVTTVSVTRTQELNPLSYAVLVDFDQPGPREYRLDGTVAGTLGASHGQMLLVLDRVGDGWRLGEGQWFKSGVPVPTATGAP